ncbi:MAG TPA: cytochrome c biogenesis heme-transporting ATPase CcmA [Ramlibacter sp.]|nr:cytochrome c biogenesis heme-transporting ATPase CcmA [Ramlibacter sp.]
MLIAEGLTCTRGERALFAGIGLAVEPGQWLHVRGANGCGKTSLLRLLAGLSRPERGEIRWLGRPLAQAKEAYRSDMVFLGHHAAVKDELTARENLELAAALDGAPLQPETSTRALRRFGLGGRENLPVRFLSAGQRRRVLLARLVARKAKLWILDEPFTALDANAVSMLSTLIGDHLADGGMAILTSHQPIDIPAATTLQL